MSFLPHLPARVYEFVAGVRAALDGFFHKAAEKTVEVRAWGQTIVDKLMERLPPGKQRPILIAFAGIVAVLALILTGTSLAARGKTGERNTAAVVTSLQPGVIPPEELFLPEEPDFVPGVILEREQRAVWTAADAALLWQDPLKNGEEPWRNRIERTIDEIMESVP